MLKTIARLMALATFIAVAAAGVARAATPEQAQALADKAASLVAKDGDKAFATLSDPNGPFHQGELYVTVLDRKGVVRANINPKLIGMNMWDARDPDGVLFTQDAWKAVANSETGWQSYKFVNPMSKKIEPKKTWVHKVGDYVVLCGAYVTP